MAISLKMAFYAHLKIFGIIERMILGLMAGTLLPNVEFIGVPLDIRATTLLAALSLERRVRPH
jgi:site-specific recombinase